MTMIYKICTKPALSALACLCIILSTLCGTPVRAQSGNQLSPLGEYYRNLEARLVGQGHLRQDRSAQGVDADRLIRSFMAIAMRSEYRVSSGGMTRSGHGTPLRRWVQPVRIGVQFGPSATAGQRQADMGLVRDVARRIGQATRHPVSVTNGQANFHVLVLNDRERAGIATTLRQLVPGISNAAVRAVTGMNRNMLCMVVALPGADPAQGYVQAVAIVRAEHPLRMRRSCIEEELAQGMGLPNDSNAAWPSIFNDDEEFGVLTRHDEMLLRMLYDRRLAPGMGARQVLAVLPELCVSVLGRG